jgi:hypothetical protein
VIDVGNDERVCREDGLDVDIDEIVERVEMLFDQTFDLEESRQQLPFILSSALRDSQKTYLDALDTFGVPIRSLALATAHQLRPFLLAGIHLWFGVLDRRGDACSLGCATLCRPLGHSLSGDSCARSGDFGFRRC